MIRAEWKRSLADVPREAWDELAVPLETPALEWEWLHCLEESGSIWPETGWLPLHLTLRSGSSLVAAAPLYVKAHSEGEFVWDYAWAEAASRLNIPFYPKLVGMSPATPITGYRFLIAPGEDEGLLTERMLSEIESLSRANNLSGVSFNYVDPEWQERMEARGFLAWRHQSFSWLAAGFRSFEEYLGAFNKNQRRNIRRERKTVERQGIALKPYAGSEITRELLERMAGFYERTNARFGPWAARYLTPGFFPLLYERFRSRLLLFAAYRGQEREPIAMSFFLLKGENLYGRYWGASERVDCLHFEACYYAPIEWAIAQGIRRFDPGIGSEHKLRRGFRAVANHSLHRFEDPRLQGLMARHIGQINRLEQENIDALNASLPFAEGRARARD